MLLLLTACILVPLRFVAPPVVGGYEVKPVDMLADVWPGGGAAAASVDTALLPAVPKVKPAFCDSCPPGMTCIVDYADSAGRGMKPFYEALERRAELGRPVRIAYFGDSFIETDILTSDLRRLLQTAFGGMGAGFVDMDPPYAANRPTVQQRSSGWTGTCVLDKGRYEAAKLNINQRYFAPSPEGAWTEVRGVKQPCLGGFTCATLYLTASAPTRVNVRLGADDYRTLDAQGTGRVEALTAEGSTSAARFTLPAGSNAVCLGVAMEGKSGVTLDNFSLRGSSGTTLLEVPERNLRSFAEVRPYDLVVLQFGLNVVQKKVLKYTWYAGQLAKVVAHVKRAFPGAGILIVGVGDREDKAADGELHTMPGVKALMRYQENVAAEQGVAFWNLYEGMGGEGSIKRMAAAKPAEAAKDYTHISRRGGRRIAEIMFKSLKHGYEQYLKRKAYEKEE